MKGTAAMEPNELKALVKNAKNGSAEDFGRLYSLYAQRLYRFAIWYLKSPDDAPDAVQDACIHAYTHIKALKKEEAFEAWLFSILANICRERLREQNKQIVISYEEHSEAIAEKTACEDDLIQSSDLKELISRLPEPDKSIVLLSCIGCFNSRQIGSRLSLNPSTVRSKLKRALQSLRNQLEI